ncbi:MAG: hypothetical protein QGI86_14115 [Candidatus Poribacteria bacterium]|nr:hypothetical protein [Candidatus Poribacteria bacterium]MDP6749585.1 hypothetical protein [Candidatus Poribacteria bacterium]
MGFLDAHIYGTLYQDRIAPDAIILESNSGKMDKGVKIVNEKGTSEGVENEGKAVSHLSLAIPLLLHKSASI